MGVIHPDKEYRGRNVDYHFICLSSPLQKLFYIPPCLIRRTEHIKKKSRLELKKKTPSHKLNYPVRSPLSSLNSITIQLWKQKKSPGANGQ